jgi:hypothetical protein
VSNADEDKGGLVGLSNEQWQTLVELLNSHKGSNTERMIGKNTTWIIDTGASNHMTGNVRIMQKTKSVQGCPVGLPNGEQAVATREGIVILETGLQLCNVLYVPGLNCNLISVSQLIDDMDCVLQFTNSVCIMQDRTSRTLIGVGERRDGLYYFRGIRHEKVCKVGDMSMLHLWHKRMGHPSMKISQLISNVGSKNNVFENKACDVCQRAKQTRDSFPLSDNKASSSFELIHCDLWGPYKTPSSCGAYYFLTIVDDFSRAVWIYLLIDKREVSQTLLNFLSLVERQYEKKIKIIRSDNGTEFTCLKTEFIKRGMIFQTSCVGTPQQNGRVERKHRHILNIARALRFQGNLPISFWGECVLTAGYLINRTPTPLLDGKTPYEMLNGKAPLYEHLRVFGSLCYAHNQGRKSDKFTSRSKKCVFVGYAPGKKGWKLFDLDNKNYFVSRDVAFFENEFPFAPVDKTLSEPTQSVESENFDTQSVASEHQEVPLEVESSEFRGGADVHEVGESQVIQQDDEHEEMNEEDLGRGKRVKIPSVKLNDYVTTYNVQHLSPSTSSLPLQQTSGAPYPIMHYTSCDNFSVKHRRFLAAVSAEKEPKFFSAAVKDPRWRTAMQQEIQALEDNHTWKLCSLPANKKALGCKWVYKIKHRSDGTIERFKARLVILGNHQVEGIDYNETFAPVAKMVTVRIVLAVAAAKNWELHQMDVHNAFLHGELQEEVFMKLPPGFRPSQPGMVCKLEKSLYGLKQAPRCWFAKLSSALKQYGFHQSYSDYSLFTLLDKNVQLVVLVYVDDLIICGNNHNSIERFKEYLSRCFHMKDLGLLKYFLGVEVARSPSGIVLCQRKYVLDIISEAGLLGAKPMPTPLEQNHNLSLAQGEFLDNPERYRRLVGRLIYLCFTRPELSYSVHILSQFMQQPRTEHWTAALRVVRYLKGNPGQGVFLDSTSDLFLHGWCDADWAACPLTRRSLTGWIIFLGNSPISWKTKKQQVVSRSSAESEYRSMANTTCELKWVKSILCSLGISHSMPMQLFCDSQFALHIAKNPVFHERTKHIEVDCHFIRNEILHGHLQPSYVSTHAQLADIFTKALGRAPFQFLLGKLGIRNLHAPT